MCRGEGRLKTCDTPGCDGKYCAKGLCKRCYERRRYRDVPEYREFSRKLSREYYRKRCRDDPEYREVRRKCSREYYRKRYHEDEEFREKMKAYQRGHQEQIIERTKYLKQLPPEELLEHVGYYGDEEESR